MILKGLIDEDFVNYGIPSMVLFFPKCSFKCEKDCGQQVCQNSALATATAIEIDYNSLCERYLKNQITQAVVCGGLEPLDSFKELITFIYTLRYKYACDDDVVIYTGYTQEECMDNGWIDELVPFGNITIKFGRFVPNQKPHYDGTLGVYLASDNQFAVKYNPR